MDRGRGVRYVHRSRMYMSGGHRTPSSPTPPNRYIWLPTSSAEWFFLAEGG
jgi:hypothetical protein